MATEPQLSLKAIDFFSVNGVAYQPGDVFSLPEREALGVVGIGAAVETGTSPADVQINLKAVDFFSDAAGVFHQPGDTFALPEREALGYIGINAAVELPS